MPPDGEPALGDLDGKGPAFRDSEENREHGSSPYPTFLYLGFILAKGSQAHLSEGFTGSS